MFNIFKDSLLYILFICLIAIGGYSVYLKLTLESMEKTNILLKQDIVNIGNSVNTMLFDNNTTFKKEITDGKISNTLNSSAIRTGKQWL